MARLRRVDCCGSGIRRVRHAALERIVRGSDPAEFPDRERIERAFLAMLS
jgi:hypothetical protein